MQIGPEKSHGVTLKPMKTIVLVVVVGSMFPLVIGQTKGTQRLSTLQAANHVGEAAIVCGKVVGARISKYSIADRGKPLTFFLDEPETNPTFFFVTWSPDPTTPQQTKAAYDGKQVCVTGKIMKMGNVPHIIATEPSQIVVQTDNKK
jgi:hypothetical protein